MRALVKANDVTRTAKNVMSIESCNMKELRKLFTGDSGQDLYVTSGDWVVAQGFSLKTKDDDLGLRASGWTHHFKQYAAENGDANNQNIVRQTYAGITIWNVEWLAKHFDEIRRRVKEQHEKKRYW